MNRENEVPYGSEPVNATDNSPEPEVKEEVVEQKEEVKEPKKDEGPSKLEKMLSDSQSMIGKQSSEISGLRKKLEEMNTPKQEKQPVGADDQISQITQQMDEGDVTIAEGMRQILALNSQYTASKVMEDFNAQMQEKETLGVQQNFLKNNPDFNEVVESGELQKYLDEDPMADEYVAYKQLKSDQQIESLKQEYETKIAEAKEEGAKLAKGSEQAGKILGKQGVPPMPKASNKPFKTQAEATEAMMAKLKEIRAGSSA